MTELLFDFSRFSFSFLAHSRYNHYIFMFQWTSVPRKDVLESLTENINDQLCNSPFSDPSKTYRFLLFPSLNPLRLVHEG